MKRFYQSVPGSVNPSRRVRRSRLASQVRKLARSTQETKFVQDGRENVQLYHDVGAGTGPTTNQLSISFDPWSLITQGTTRSTRIGDKVLPVGHRIRLWLSNKSDRYDVLYRVIVVVLPRALGTTVPNGGNVDLFRSMDSGTNNSTMCGIIDKENVKKVLLDKTYKVSNVNGNAVETHEVKDFWIKAVRPRPIEYVNNGAGHKNNFYAVYVIPYDAYGTLQTDNIASCAYVQRLYFKDA